MAIILDSKPDQGMIDLHRPHLVAADNLVGWWRMAEGGGGSVRDDSGNGHDGVWSGTGSWWGSGQYGAAAEFNGSNDYLNVGDIDMSTITITAWIYPHSYGAHTNGLGRIIDKHSAAVGGSYALALNKNFAGLGTNTLIFYDGDEWAASNNNAINLNQWQLVSVVADGSTSIKFYVNGAAQGTASGTHSIGQNNDSVFIGKYSDSAGFEFDGLIDDVRIYNRALTQNEIQQIMLYGDRKIELPYVVKAAAVETGGVIDSPTILDDKPDLGMIDLHRPFLVAADNLVGWWRMAEGGGGSVQDDSGNGNTGTFSGSGSWWASGQFGAAAQFSSDYMSVSHDDSLYCATGISFTAWIKPSALAGARTIIDKRSGGDNSYQFGLDSAKVKILIDTGSAVSVLSTTTVVADTWYLVAGTWDGTTIKVYVNGKLENSDSQSGSMDNNSTTLIIGNDDDQNEPYSGILDDIRIYNRALSQAEIQEIMDEGDRKIELPYAVNVAAAVANAPTGTFYGPLYGPLAGPI